MASAPCCRKGPGGLWGKLPADQLLGLALSSSESCDTAKLSGRQALGPFHVATLPSP